VRTWGLATLLAGILIALTPAVAQAHFTTFPSGSPLNGDTTVVTGLCAATGVAVDSAHLWVNDACSGQTTRYPTGERRRGLPMWAPSRTD
jgi:hypothetical protein